MSDRPTKRQGVWPAIESSRCTGCGWCVAACPDHLLVLEVGADRRKSAQLVHAERCPGCGKCLPVCNFQAIRLAKRIDGGAPRD